MDLHLSQTQNTKLSTKMIQSTAILQMNAQMLDSYIENLVLENPVIDLIENTSEEIIHTSNHTDDRVGYTDEQNRIYYKEDRRENSKWDFSVVEEDLYTYVISQLIYEIKMSRDHDILEFLVYSLDEKGYLDLEDTAGSKILQISLDEYKKYVDVLQSVEPAGIGARNLTECLLLQLNRLELPSHELELMSCIINQYIEDIGNNRIKYVAQKLNISVAELSGYIKILRKLNPKPANGFYIRENFKYIQPDVFVVKFKDYFEVLASEGRYTEIQINHDYMNMLKAGCSDEVESYIKNMKQQADWVKTCISQRSKTLINVTKVIIKLQNDFFETTHGQLKSMKMSDVAELLGIHESTVSRATKNKYLQCSRGIFPLNYFFVKQFTSVSLTPIAIKEMIRTIIQNEDKMHPISDQKIEFEMAKKGVDIKRRTIAKYRQSMGIRNADGRKQYE